MSTSAAQSCANARNAQSSTGPRTAEGKARSSQNATRHGIFSSRLLLPGEDAHDLDELRLGLLRRLKPIDTLERVLAERVVACTWKLRRVLDAERALVEHAASNVKRLKAAHLQQVRDWNEDNAEFEKEKAERPKPTTEKELQADEEEQFDHDYASVQLAADIAIQAFAPAPTGASLMTNAITSKDFDRLARYEAMQERAMYKAMKELRELKKMREEDEAEEWIEEEVIAQNEANLGEVEEDVAESAKGAEGAKGEEIEIAQNEPNFSGENALDQASNDALNATAQNEPNSQVRSSVNPSDANIPTVAAG